MDKNRHRTGFPVGLLQGFFQKAFRYLRPEASQARLYDTLTNLTRVTIILLVATLLGLWADDLGVSDPNVIMMYILGALTTAIITSGKLPSTAYSISSCILYNFIFVDPRLSLQVYDPGSPITLLTMLASSLIVETLTMRVKKQAQLAAQQAKRTQILLDTSQKLQQAETCMEIFQTAALNLQTLLNRTIVLCPAGKDQAPPGYHLEAPILFPANGEAFPEQWILPCQQAASSLAGQPAPLTDTFVDMGGGYKCLLLPICQESHVFAVAAAPLEKHADMEPLERNLLVAMLSECGLALEKALVSQEKREIEIHAHQEQTRANLLRTLSHDLRTPLTSISGNAAILMESGDTLNSEKRSQLYTDIYDDAIWLNGLVENLLSITRLENMPEIRMQEELLEDVINEALLHVNRSASCSILTTLSDDFLMARMDARLIMQVIINLVENAIKYTPPDSKIHICAAKKGDAVEVRIADDGPGIPDSSKPFLFDMFYTSSTQKLADGQRSLGLGLFLCRSIISAHGGQISVEDNHPRGTVFIFTLPAAEQYENG